MPPLHKRKQMQAESITGADVAALVSHALSVATDVLPELAEQPAKRTRRNGELPADADVKSASYQGQPHQGGFSLLRIKEIPDWGNQ